MVSFGNDWDALLADEFKKDYYLRLREFLKTEYRDKIIYPLVNDIFNALRYTPYGSVKAVIVGQDPYIKAGEAHGLAFSVLPNAAAPPSLCNILKELYDDVGISEPEDGCLINWAKRGVLLLNAVLTVERGKSRSHAGKGWETFTDRVLDLLNERETAVVFMLWGRDAQAKGARINNPRHLILTAAHPSPLAGGRFGGCGHFSRANHFLALNGISPIDWNLGAK
ncbi:MAG: uracil-DNA glycosylase [Defluviitaleaceae bacterium]|nr:uracil-DNA glycosylase [Defluviitaleaceae bacterium]